MEKVSFFARHLVPPCAQVCLTAAGKHLFSFSVSDSVSPPFSERVPERQFEKTPRANLRSSGRRHAPSLTCLGGGGDGQKAGNGSPLASVVFQSETEHP